MADFERWAAASMPAFGWTNALIASIAVSQAPIPLFVRY
jgi:hypothetical protein